VERGMGNGVTVGSVEGGVRGRVPAGSVLGALRRTVVERWGAHLESQELHSEAALAFLTAGRPFAPWLHTARQATGAPPSGWRAACTGVPSE